MVIVYTQYIRTLKESHTQTQYSHIVLTTLIYTCVTGLTHALALHSHQNKIRNKKKQKQNK